MQTRLKRPGRDNRKRSTGSEKPVLEITGSSTRPRGNSSTCGVLDDTKTWGSCTMVRMGHMWDSGKAPAHIDETNHHKKWQCGLKLRNRPITVFVINSPGVQKVAGGTTHSSSSMTRNQGNNVPPSFTKDFEVRRVRIRSSRRVTTEGSSSTPWQNWGISLARGAVSTSTISSSHPTHLSGTSNYESSAVILKLVNVKKTQSLKN